MYKKLFNQIKNEWHSNLWLIAELLLVSVILWFIVDYIYVNVSIYTQPLGFDISHCYKLDMNALTPSDPGYTPGDTIPGNDIQELVKRLQYRSDIEAVSVSNSSYPYNESYRGGPFRWKNIAVNQISYHSVTPDFFRVFRYRGANGETPEKLAQMLNNHRDGFMASNDIFPLKYHIKLTTLTGQHFHLEDSTKSLRLLCAYQPVRRSGYDEFYQSRSITRYLKPSRMGISSELCIRVKADRDIDFKEILWKYADKQLRIGNCYILNITSFSDIRKIYEQDDSNKMRKYIFGAVFLMLNIFLGLLGTFWFRTQQRHTEIALFKALGATNKNIFGREIAEGLLLLTIATVPAVIIDWNLSYGGLNAYMESNTLETGRFIVTVLATWMLIALMIVLGSWIPARKAMKIQPAEALHEE